MQSKRVILCAWTGIETEDGPPVGCDRPAIGYVERRDGHRVYTCESHVGHAKRDAESGDFVRNVLPDDRVPPSTRHGISRQSRHQESAVGGFE